MARAIIGALLLIVVGVFLGGTVLRDQVASARSLAQSVVVNNTPAQAVPVREQNLDASGNIKVHEQGSVQVAAPVPITDGGNFLHGLTSDPINTIAPQTATALSVHLNSGVNVMQLRFGEGRVASFPGPNADGKADFDLALTRPIMFDTMTCVGSTGGHCVLSWVGAQP